ncbi:MAG: ABC transporter substrate-binding protein [Acetatifactor sp.]
MRQIAKRFIAVAMGTVLCLSMLVGCGQGSGEMGNSSETGTETMSDAPENSSEGVPAYMTPDNSGDATAERVPVLEGREPYDLLTQSWQAPREETAAPRWWNQTVYRENLLQDPPDMAVADKHRAVKDGSYYILAVYDNVRAQEEGIDTLYYLNRIDGDTLETECHRLHLEEMDTSAPLHVLSLDVAEDRAVVFACEWDAESDQLTGYYAVWFDREGHMESSQDLLPALREARLDTEDGYLRRLAAKWDSRGYYCVEGVDGSGLYAVIDGAGALNTVLDPVKGLEAPVVQLLHDSQGRCVWETSSYQNGCNVFWGMDGGKQVKLFEGDHQGLRGRAVNAYGDLYYVSDRGALVRWDASCGSCESLYLGGGGAFGDYEAILQSSNGDLVLFYDDGIRDYLFRFANEDVEQVELTLAYYYAGVDYYTDTLVQEFNRTHEGIQINLQAPSEWQQQDSDWMRVQADLVAGHGPDLLMAPPAQLKMLQEKGLLTELSQTVDSETREQIFPGVLEHGTFDGGLYSISYLANARYSALIASKELCPTGTWTWEEAVDLLEKLEQEGRPVHAVTNGWGGTSALSGSNLLCGFFLRDLEHCSLLDLENGKAYFDTEEFCHLLEICKRYSEKENASEFGNTVMNDNIGAETRKQLKQGEILCYTPVGIGLADFISFSEDMADLGEDYHVVGYPTDGGNGRFMRCTEGAAINSFSYHREAAEEFIRYIVSQEAQMVADAPVRRDTYEERVVKSDTVYWTIPGGKMIKVYAKPDKTSYLPEYLELLEQCTRDSGMLDMLKDIIREETEAFFSGNKDARAVADTIQSRVQIYLDENR